MREMSNKMYMQDGKLVVPDHVVIPFIEGDGVGAEITPVCQKIVNTAVELAYVGKRRIEWKEVLAGGKAFEQTGEWLPEATLEAFKEYLVGIKGPLTTPVGGGIRSLNVALRQTLDLYVCLRPVRWFKGVVSPVREPHKVNMHIFRENTEDLYAGVEWDHDTPEAERVIALIKELGKNVRPHSAIGIKPISEFGSKRLVRMAIQYAIDHKLPNVTLVHKGNIMKFTEGGFRRWGYEVAAEEFGDVTITEEEVTKNFGGKAPEGKIVIKDRITDAMFQQILLRPAEYSVLALPNLNGDYMSDALAAEVGGLGMAPGSNIGEGYAIFEATHGTAPKYAGQDKTNPGSIILSGALMLEYIGWKEAAELIRKAVEKTVAAKTVTYDLARQMPGATKISCSAFGKAICEHM